MTKDKLNMLKEKLLNSSDFNEPYDFFFDHFGFVEAFMNDSKEIRDQFMEGVIQEAGSQLANQPQAMLTRQLFLHHKSLGIRHGGCFIGSQLITYFFIEGLNMGLIALANSPDDPNVTFARFHEEIGSDETSRFIPLNKEQAN